MQPTLAEQFGPYLVIIVLALLACTIGITVCKKKKLFIFKAAAGAQVNGAYEGG